MSARAALALLLWVAPGSAGGAAEPGYDLLVVVGSDTMAALVRAWAGDVQRGDAAFRFEIEALGSSTAPPALVSGRASLGAMTREMKWAEREAFRSRYGRDPVALRVAFDAVVVFVHPESSLEALTIPELDAIYSRTRRCGSSAPVQRWEDVGEVGPRAGSFVLPCGRSRRSGTRDFFRERALCGGFFREDLREQPGAGSVVRFVAEDLCGIGYSGLATPREGVRELALAVDADAAPAPASAAAIYAGSYPLMRFLYLYLDRDPTLPLPPEVEAFVRHALSPAEERAREAGYLPLPGELLSEELAKLGAPELTPPAR